MWLNNKITYFSDHLANNSRLNLLVLLLYFIGVVLPHKWFGGVIVDVFSGFSRRSYQTVMLLIAVFLFSGYLYSLLKTFWKEKPGTRVYFALVMLLGLTVLSYPVLIIHNVEAIHFPQYAILAVLLFPLFDNFYKTAFWGLLLAFIDESYQFFYIDPIAYFDFNDIILDQLGLFYGLFPLIFKPVRLKGYRLEIAVILVIALTVFILSQTNVIGFHPGQNAVIELVKEPQASFWTTIGHLEVSYHIVLPYEGMVVITILYFYFCRVFSYQKYQ